MKFNYKLFLAHQIYNKHIFSNNICTCGAKTTPFKLEEVLYAGPEAVEYYIWKYKKFGHSDSTSKLWDVQKKIVKLGLKLVENLEKISQNYQNLGYFIYLIKKDIWRLRLLEYDVDWMKIYLFKIKIPSKLKKYLIEPNVLQIKSVIIPKELELPIEDIIKNKLYNYLKKEDNEFALHPQHYTEFNDLEIDFLKKIIYKINEAFE